MIVDIFNEVFTRVKDEITTADVVASYVNSSEGVFPIVSIVEISNVTDTDSISTSGENFRIITLEVNIFSNSPNYKNDINPLRDKVDYVLADLYRMTCTFTGITPNFIDNNIMRYTMRYEFKISKNKDIYRR